MIAVQRIACVSCGAAISVPGDINRLNCAHCGTALSVQRGEGYIAAKLVDQVGRSIAASGAATVDELRRSQLHQELLSLRQQVADLESEERRLRLMGKNKAAQGQRVAVERQWNTIVARLMEVERGLGLRPTYERAVRPAGRKPGQQLSDLVAVIGAICTVLSVGAQQWAVLGVGVLMIAAGLVGRRMLKF